MAGEDEVEFMSTSNEEHEQRIQALKKTIEVTAKKMGQSFVPLVLLIGIAAIIPEQLPPAYATLIEGVLVNAISNILDRIARNEISEEEIAKEVEKVFLKFGVDRLVSKDDFYHAFSHLRKGQKNLESQNKEIYNLLANVSYQLEEKSLNEAILYTKLRPIKLPPIIVPFVNRERELERIKFILRQSGAYAILGVAGTGKTALANYVTHQLDDENIFKDGIVWLDLREITTKELAIQQICRYFDFPKTEDSAELTLYLSSKRALLILDNADEITSNDISEILNSRGRCSVLITSRQTDVTLQRIIKEPIEPLPLNSAKELLSLLINDFDKQNEKNLIRICEALGRLPLAIELASGFLKFYDLRPIEYLNELTEKPLRGIEKIRDAFDFTYERLGGKSSEILRLIGLLRGEDFSSSVIAAGLEMTEDESQKYLLDLVSKFILKKTNRVDRFSIHPLLRAYCSEKLTNIEKHTFLERLTAYYITYCNIYGGKERFTNYSEIEIEIYNILLVTEWCFMNNNLVNYLQILSNVSFYILTRGYSDQVLELANQLMNFVQINPDSAEATWELAHTIYWLILQDKYDISMKIIDLLLPIFEDQEDVGGIAHMNRNLGELEERKGNLDLALSYYEKTLALCKSLPDVLDTGIIFNNMRSRVAWTTWKLGHLQHMMGNFQEAETLLSEALKLQRERKAKHGIGATLYELGHLERARNNFRKAKEYYEYSLKLLKGDSHILYAAEAKSGLGKTEIALNHPIKAIRNLREAMELFQLLGMNREIRELRFLIYHIWERQKVA